MIIVSRQTSGRARRKSYIASATVARGSPQTDDWFPSPTPFPFITRFFNQSKFPTFWTIKEGLSLKTKQCLQIWAFIEIFLLIQYLLPTRSGLPFLLYPLLRFGSKAAKLSPLSFYLTFVANGGLSEDGYQDDTVHEPRLVRVIWFPFHFRGADQARLWNVHFLPSSQSNNICMTQPQKKLLIFT